jgi:inorganic pyrophosphatase
MKDKRTIFERESKAKNKNKKNDKTDRVLSLQVLDAAKQFNVIIETPRNARNKYKYDLQSGLFECERALPRGMVFPFDFGFIPSTKCEDGDPLDALVLMDEPTCPGTIVRARVIGVMEAEQTELDGQTIRNDRLLCVHHGSLEYAHYMRWQDLPQSMRAQIEEFFVAYNEVRDKKFKVIGWHGANRAKKLINQSLVA